MKKHFYILALISIIVAACCDDPVEIARFELNQSEKDLIPYSQNQQITFVHSNGYEFDFEVVNDELIWQEHHDFCEWGCCGKEYFSFQVKTVNLEAEYPLIGMSLSVGGDQWYEYYPDVLLVHFNRNSLSLPYDNNANFICDTLTKTEYFDSLLFGTQMFYGVYAKDFDSNYFADTSVLNAKTLYYNSTGIIQIKMTNDETFTIKN
jgi:hypothetical protein